MKGFTPHHFLRKKFSQTKTTKSGAGFTLIEVLVGVFLMLIVFLGIFGAYQLMIKVVAQSQAQVIAAAVANQRIEMIRNLPYGSIGVVGGFPDGVLETTSIVTRNGIEYTIETRVDYVIDSSDGVAPPEDECPNDYKKLDVKVTWSGFFGGEVVLATDAAPKNFAQECAETGGILLISAFDAYGLMVPFPTIEVKDPDTDETIKTASPSDGKHYFSLTPSAYKVVVSKAGYSSERSYGIEEVTTPERPHSIVLEGQLTEASLSIDKVSSFSIDTLSPWGGDYFSDFFSDESKISESSGITVSGGQVSLEKISETEYSTSGYLISASIVPENLINWEEFLFTDEEPPGTQIVYQVLYFDGGNWILVPDIDLPGNSLGFAASPVGLEGLPILYSQLRVKANLSTVNQTISPILYDWQTSWINNEATQIPNAVFNLQGAKIIGTDVNENPVYKYSQNHTANSLGHIDIAGLEWDSYTFLIDPVSGLDLTGTDPFPQPISLLPDSVVSVILYLESENSLFVYVEDTTTGTPVFSASVRLYNISLSYDQTQYTNEKGQTYFIPLEAANYNLEVGASGYSAVSTSVFVSGDNLKNIGLEQVE